MKAGHIPARNEYRKLALLIAIDKIDKPSMANLVETTGIPARSVDSIIKNATKFGVVIRRKGGRKYGHFSLQNPGVYNIGKIPELLNKNFPLIMENINSACKLPY